MTEVKKYCLIRNTDGDTRTASKEVTFWRFQDANDKHRSDVYHIMSKISKMIEDAGWSHDYTKKTLEEMFYDDFKKTLETGCDFTKCVWYQRHINSERHHLLARCPDDVNLIDVIEMVVDCTCAGLARSGEARPLEINADILNKAVANTVELIQNMVEVKERK